MEDGKYGWLWLGQEPAMARAGTLKYRKQRRGLGARKISASELLHHDPRRRGCAPPGPARRPPRRSAPFEAPPAPVTPRRPLPCSRAANDA